MAELAGRGHPGRCARLLHLAHAQSQTLDGKHTPTLRAAEAELTAIAARHARGRRRLAAGRLRFRRPGRRVRDVAPPGRAVRPADDAHAAAGRRAAGRLERRCSARSVRPTPPGCASPARSAPARPACCSASSCRRTRSSAGRAISGSPTSRSPSGSPPARAGIPRSAAGEPHERQAGAAARRALGADVPAGRSAGLRTAAGGERRRARRARGPSARGGRLRPADAARRQGHPVSAGHQLCRRQSRRRAGDDRRSEHAARPRRRRRACRHHVRRHRDQLHAHALDARPRTRCAVPGCLGGQAADRTTTRPRSACTTAACCGAA